jgi:hypothetical protein
LEPEVIILCCLLLRRVEVEEDSPVPEALPKKFIIATEVMTRKIASCHKQLNIVVDIPDVIRSPDRASAARPGTTTDLLSSFKWLKQTGVQSDGRTVQRPPSYIFFE